MNRIVAGVVVCLLGLPLVITLPVNSQVVNATLNGHVLDTSGGVIPGATITATNDATGFSRSTTASGQGDYNITALPPGTYTVTATAKGFKKEAKAVTLLVGQAATIDFTLAVGETTQQVTIEATTEVTEPTRTQVSTVIQERQIENLPVNGRQFIDFALLSPAVQIGDTTSGSTDVIVEPVTKLSFAGQNIHFNFIAVDGADDISTVSGIQRGTPPQESVQEFRVINTNYSTEMGRAVGGIVNIITKSGTNNWHGTLYEYFRNDVLDAKSILAAPGLNTLRQNQFGGSVGGPIKKDKTFIFANYEGQRRGESPYYNSVVLNNINAINNVKTTVYGLPPEPAGLNVLRTGDYDNGFIRLDHSFTDRQTFMARYFVNDGRLLNQSPLNDGFDLPSAFKNNFINDQSFAASLTSVISPKIVNEVRGQFARRHFDFPTVSTQPHLEVANTFTVGVNRGNPDLYIEDRGEIVDNVTIILPKNTISFGGNFNYVRSTESFPLFYPFEADYANLNAFLGTDGAVTGCGLPTCPDPFVVFFERFQAPNFNEPTLANFAQVYAGGAIPSAIRNQAKGTLNHTYNGLYIQNKWRATNKLTINYGLRWEFETWPSEALNNQYNNFDPRLGVAYQVGGPWNFVIRAGGGLFHGIIPAPLLGCQIPSCGGTSKFPGIPELDNLNSRTLLWAYAGVPADTNAAIQALLATGTYPDAAPVPAYVTGPNASCPVNNTLTGPANFLSECIDSFFGPATVVRFDKDHKNPYGVQASLSVEFSPFKDTTVSVSYLKVKGVHLGSFFNVNQPLPQQSVLVHGDSGATTGCKNAYYLIPFGLTPTSPCGTTYAFPGSTGVPGTACELNGISCPANYAIYFEATSRWNSDFNGLLVNVNKRLSHHFSAGVSYTFSHTIDDGPNPSFVLIPQDSLNFGAEKANSADDVRHRFVANAVISSPTTGSMWFRDFQLGTIVTLQSAPFFTKFSGFDSNGDIFGNNDRVGLEGRDTFRGKNLYTFDLRGSRSFTFREHHKIEFLAEAFNIFNHVNIKYFNTVYGSADFCNVSPVPAACGTGPFFFQGSPNPNYGTPRAVFNPRQIQLALRYSW
jgi:hypothetical protein